jgi:hypothetical protein
VRVTRTYPLWALFVAVAVACALLARRRRVGVVRLLAAWVLSSVLLWLGAGSLGFLGGALEAALARARVIRESSDMAGFSIGAPLGAILGALLGIALADRALRKAWPRWPALAFAAATLVAAAALVLFILQGLAQTEQQAGKSVLVVFPLLGAAPVLGWLVGTRQ